MESLFGDTNEHIAALGHKLEIGSKVEWNTSGYILIGKIVAFEGDKCKVQTIGCRYLDNNELEKIQNKAKPFYKVASHRLFLLEERKNNIKV